jgi:hypothetical protein
MSRVSTALALLTIIVLAVALVPGGKHEHKGKPTDEMKQALDLVMAELKTRYNDELTLSQIVKIETQVVAGLNMFFTFKVKGSKTGEYLLHAAVNHRIHGPMSIVSIRELNHTGGKHQHEGDLTDDMKRALEVSMKFLSDQHNETMKLVEVKEVHTQVVASINYHFLIDIESDTHDAHEVEIVVHHNFDDSMRVIVVKDVHIQIQHVDDEGDDESSGEEPTKLGFERVLGIAEHLFSFIRGITAVGEGEKINGERSILVEVDEEYIQGTIPDVYLGYPVRFSKYPGE